MPPASTSPRVTVAVITHNDRAYLPDCLASLARQTGVDGGVELLLVDNASTDESVAWAGANYPLLRVIRHAENLGFCRALNHAAQAVAAPYLAFLNPDTRVEPDWLARLLACAKQHAVPCVGGKILTWDGQRIDFGGTQLNLSGYGIQEGYGEPAADNFTEDREILAPCGGAMLIERELFNALGGFDPALGAFYEDLDLGWRLWQAGHSVRYAAQAVAYHHGSGTWRRADFARRQRLWGRNALRVMLTNLEEPSFRRLATPLIALALKRGLLSLSAAAGEPGTRADWPLPGTAEQERWQTGVAQLQALDEVLTALPEIIIRRAAVQQLRQRPDNDIFTRFQFTPLFRGLFEHPEHDLQVSRLLELFDLSPVLSPEAAERFQQSALGVCAQELTRRSDAEALAHDLARRASAHAAAEQTRATLREQQLADVRSELAAIHSELAACREYAAATQHDLDQHRAFAKRVRASLPYRLYAFCRRLLP